jgi:anti-anti-sigma factor
MGDKQRPTSQMIKVRCPNPNCRRVLAVKAELAGRKGRCPICKQAMSIPKLPDSGKKETTVVGQAPPPTHGNTVTLSAPPESPGPEAPDDQSLDDSQRLTLGEGKGFTPAIRERRQKTSQIMSFAKGQALSDAPAENPPEAPPPNGLVSIVPPKSPIERELDLEEPVFPPLDMPTQVIPASSPPQSARPLPVEAEPPVFPSLEMPTQAIPSVPQTPPVPAQPPKPEPMPEPPKAAPSPMAPSRRIVPLKSEPSKPPLSATLPTLRIQVPQPPVLKPVSPPSTPPAAHEAQAKPPAPPQQPDAMPFPEMPTQKIAIPPSLLQSKQQHSAPPPAPPADEAPQEPARPKLMTRAEALQPPPLEEVSAKAGSGHPKPSDVKPRPIEPVPQPEPQPMPPPAAPPAAPRATPPPAPQRPRRQEPHDPWASEEPIRPIERPSTRMILNAAGDSMRPGWLDEGEGKKKEKPPAEPPAQVPLGPPPPSAISLLASALPKKSVAPAQPTPPREDSAIDQDFAEARRVRRERRQRNTSERPSARKEKPRDEVVYEIVGGVLKVAGPVGYDLDSRFADYCEQLLKSAGADLVVDLSEVSYLSSTYLGVIAPLFPRAADAGKTVLVRANAKVARVLRLAGFDRLGRLEEV